jgi:hypothetical protein
MLTGSGLMPYRNHDRCTPLIFFLVSFTQFDANITVPKNSEPEC